MFRLFFMVFFVFSFQGCSILGDASNIYSKLHKNDNGINATANIGDNKKIVKVGDKDNYSIGKTNAIYVNKASIGYIVANNILVILIFIICLGAIIYLIGKYQKSPTECKRMQEKDKSYHKLIQKIIEGKKQ